VGEVHKKKETKPAHSYKNKTIFVWRAYRRSIIRRQQSRHLAQFSRAQIGP